MKVICAGPPKSGTKSIAKALRILGYTVYDLDEHWRYHLDEWNQALGGDLPEFKLMYKGVDAVTDSPPWYFYNELHKTFPDAKVVLSVRESDEHWLRSFLMTIKIWKSICLTPRAMLGFILTPTGRKWAKLMKLSGEVTLRNLAGEDLVHIYREHLAKVKTTVPEEKLLVYQVSEGWKPLCDFLGHEIPSVNFPRENLRNELIPGMIQNSSIAKKVHRELHVMLAILIGFFVIISAICLSSW